MYPLYKFLKFLLVIVYYCFQIKNIIKKDSISLNGKFQTCNNCKKVKTIIDFGLKKDNKPYCECIECRDKKKEKKSTRYNKNGKTTYKFIYKS